MTEALRIRPTLAALLVVVAGGATIAGAWAFELVGGLEPCPLCLEQRWPYYLGLPVALLAAGLAVQGRARAAGWLLVAVAVVLAYGAGLAVYHSGIEWGWWRGPDACAAAGGLPADAAGLAASLEEGRVPSCADAAWRFLGLSLAGWNALISAGLATIAGLGAAAPLRAGLRPR